VIVAQPIDRRWELDATRLESILVDCEEEAKHSDIRGSQLTPFILARLAEKTAGQSLLANKALIIANAILAAQAARDFEKAEYRGVKHSEVIAD
jgi:pseudouridine-5'-phosphate glycosidase